MAPKVLVINKDFAQRDYVPNGADIIEVLLNRLKYNYQIVHSINDVTAEDYADFDCVFAHVPKNELKSLEILAKAFPEVGLILTTGDHSEGPYFELCRDINGRYFLPKPFGLDIFRNSIDSVVKEAKGKKENALKGEEVL